jgi:hypothetical protein
MEPWRIAIRVGYMNESVNDAFGKWTITEVAP